MFPASLIRDDSKHNVGQPKQVCVKYEPAKYVLLNDMVWSMISLQRIASGSW